MSNNFRAYGDDGVPVPVTATSAATALHTDPNMARAAQDVLVDNRGAADAYIRVGDETVSASTLCVRVPAGAVLAFSKGPATHLAAITASGTTNLVVHLGEGQ